MTSVLNTGMMPINPVGNTIRRLEAALEAERKDKLLLLSALETVQPDVISEYVRLKEEQVAKAEAAAAALAAAEAAKKAQPTAPVRTRRF